MTNEKQKLLFGNRDQLDIRYGNGGCAPRLIVDQRHLAENTVRWQLADGPVADLDAYLALPDDEELVGVVSLPEDDAASLEELCINVVTRQYFKAGVMFHRCPPF